MIPAIAWFFVLMLIALWSLAAWALHGVAVWAVSNAGAWAGTGPGAWNLPAAWSEWLPPQVLVALQEGLAGLGPWVESLLQAAPALASGLGVLAWGVWAIGSLLLALIGVGLHLLIAAWRRRRQTDGRPGAPRPAAG